LKNTRHALYGTLNSWKIQGIDVIDKNGALQSPLAPFLEWVSLMYVAASECGERSKVKCNMKKCKSNVPYCHLHFFLWVFHQTTIQCDYAKTLHVVCEGPSLCHNIGGGSDVSSPNPMDHPAHDHSQHHTAFNY
jgi:hypothetical protein